MVISKMFLFSPLFGEDEPILTINIFERGWFNHQLDMLFQILNIDSIDTVKTRQSYTHTIHVWYIYLYEWLIFMGFHAGKYYTSPMEHMGI